MNSIISNLNKNDTIASLKMNLHHPSSLGLHIVVEGTSDIIFLSSLLDNIFIYESHSGKEGVFEILEIVYSTKVIGICDRDFDLRTNSRIFYYDGISLETMMIMNDEAFNKVLNQFFVYEEEKKNFKQEVFSCATPISILRKKSYENEWHIKFDVIKPSHYIKNKKCDINSLMEKCSLVNSNFDFSCLNIEEIQPETYPIELLHGHDLVSIIAFLIKNKPKTIEQMLRIAYTKEHFFSTHIYKSISDYEISQK
ncbi:MAG: DUF4435 domain-containing protein [Candidatus Cloacimonetes bacterium]|nr:DUF4435 domain-containing protein [Candidatus Cloacimonadota bacterium]